MCTEEEFKLFYEHNLQKRLQDMDSLRKPARKASKARNRNIAGLIIAVIFLQFTWYTGSALAVGYVIFNSIITRKYNNSEAQLRDTFKKEIIEAIIKFISPTLNYQPNKGISPYEYVYGQFTKEADIYGKYDDLVSGTIDDISIRFSELHIHVRTDEDPGPKIFQGLFLLTESTKDFTGCVMLLSRTINLSELANQPKSRKRIILEDYEFNQLFHCYADDDVTARYILSANLMARLVEFIRKFKKTPVRISFVDGRIYMAISHTKSLFEPVVSKPLDNYEEALAYFEEINIAVSIVKELNLSNKLWTKE
jgi:hypothetical protein